MKEKIYVIDRIEGSFAVCECMITGEKAEINIKNLPSDIREGDIIRRDGGGYVIDPDLSKQRLADLTARMNTLFKRGI